MIIIGCDYHPSFQQIAFVDTETGELQELRLAHREVAEKFYRDLAAGGGKVRVGMEASGQARWFERLLAELKIELWIGDAAEIRAKRVRKKKTDREDARHILQLLIEDRFPKIWVPSWGNRDLRQLLWHRHRMVQMRTRIMNQLQCDARTDERGGFDFGALREGHYTLVIDWPAEYSNLFDVEIKKLPTETSSVEIDVSPVDPDCTGGHEFISHSK
jgi:transposase